MPDPPTRDCHRYLSNRLNQLDYKNAIEQKLPIGSGEIESANRSIIQSRLKLPGAWWKINNAQSMANLQALRHNGQWEKYWDSIRKATESPSLNNTFYDFAIFKIPSNIPSNDLKLH